MSGSLFWFLVGDGSAGCEAVGVGDGFDDVGFEGVIRPGFLGGSRVWKDEGYVKGNHNRYTDDSSVYKG